MPVIGTLLTQPMADVAKAHIDTCVRELRDVASAARRNGADMRSNDIQLRPMSQNDVERAWELLQPNVLWRPDNNCGPRAIVSAHTINREFGGGLSGLDDAASMAVGVQPHTFRRIGTSGQYYYHAFPVVQRIGDAEPLVLDPRMFSEPVPLSVMHEAVKGRAPIEIWSPVQNYGFELPTYLSAMRRHSVPPVFNQYGNLLKESWQEGVRAGVVLDNVPARPRTPAAAGAPR